MARSTTHIIGCGDIGRRVACLYLKADTGVTAWVKSEASYQACQRMGLEAHRNDFDLHFTFKISDVKNRILYTVPPPPYGKEDTRLRTLLEQIDATKINKFVLISTTGVYGDCDGNWVDETTPIKPEADRALRRADAEASLQTWADRYAINYLILRVPGIYAADRLPLERLKAGTPIVAPTEAPWTNRIHADDLASPCFSALNGQAANEIINVSDDAPGTMAEYFSAVADFAGFPHPPYISLREARRTLSPGMLSYLAESRRVRNDKMKQLLGIHLRYPSLKQGLAPNTRF